MQKTANYQLNQWEDSDRVRRSDFNADNAKLDSALAALAAASPNFVVGTYVGTGTYGSSNPNTLTFSFKPKLAIIFTSEIQYGKLLLAPYNTGQKMLYLIDSNNRVYAQWSGNTLTWSVLENSAEGQLNSSGMTYYYIAF